MNHNIPKHVLNSTLDYCIEEFIRDPETQSILRDKWFNKMTFEEIAEKYDYSVTTIKRKVYKFGDIVIQNALEMDK